MKRSDASAEAVTIASEWRVPLRLTWSIASLERVDDGDRQLQVEELGRPVLLARLADRDAAGGGSDPLVADQLDAGFGEVGEGRRQEGIGDGGVDEQRLGRVADAGALDLGVDGDPARHLEVGLGVDVDVAVAGGGVDDRDGGDVGERRLQAFAAARDQQVDQPLLGGELREPLVASAGEQLDGVVGQAGLGERLADDRRQRPVGAFGVAESRAGRSRCRS